MATVEEAVYGRLAGYAGLTALVSTRIYPSKAPAAPTMPLVVYQRINTMRDHAMSADTGLVAATLQVTAWAKSYEAMAAVAAQIRAALQDYTGTPVGGGVTIQRAFLEGEYDIGFDLDAAAHGRVLDFRVWYRE